MSTNFPSGLKSRGIPVGGIITNGTAYFLDGANGNDGNSGKDIGAPFKLPATAIDAMASNANDVLYVLASTTAADFASAYTFDQNQCSVIGLDRGGRAWHRCRIGASDNFAPMLTVSGSYNRFENLRFGYGRGSATNTTLLNVTGHYNTFVNCHFAGPFHATESGTNGYRNVTITGGASNFFVGCTFGVDSIQVTSTDFAHVEFLSGAGENIFEDCYFVKWIPNAGCVAGVDDVAALLGNATSRWNSFERCKFISFCSNWTAAASGSLNIYSTGAGIVLVKDCSFLNYTEVQSQGGGRIRVDGAAPTAASSGIMVTPT